METIVLHFLTLFAWLTFLYFGFGMAIAFLMYDRNKAVNVSIKEYAVISFLASICWLVSYYFL